MKRTVPAPAPAGSVAARRQAATTPATATDRAERPAAPTGGRARPVPSSPPGSLRPGPVLLAPCGPPANLPRRGRPGPAAPNPAAPGARRHQSAMTARTRGTGAPGCRLPMPCLPLPARAPAAGIPPADPRGRLPGFPACTLLTPTGADPIRGPLQHAHSAVSADPGSSPD